MHLFQGAFKVVVVYRRAIGSQHMFFWSFMFVFVTFAGHYCTRYYPKAQV